MIMTTVTGCILARNEEELIIGCINSLKPFVDEIIVVDNGSTDKTSEIARENGCLIIHSPESDVDKGRNKYIEEANMDWLLILDADERLDINKKELFFSALNTANEEVMQFRIPWYNYTGNGRFVETSTAARIIRRDPRIKYNDFAIHASTTDSVRAMGGKSVNLNFPIHHYDILFPERTKNKRKLYRNKIEEKIKRQVDGEVSCSLENIYVQYLFLGVEYSAVGEYLSAIANYDYVINSVDGTADMAILFKAYTLLCMKELSAAYELATSLLGKGVFIERAAALQAEVLTQLNKKDDAIRISLDALHHNVESANTLINLGILCEDKEPESALDYFKRAINVNPRIIDKFIYRTPCFPNVYSFQETIITSYRGMFSHMKYCHEILGLSIEKEYWREKEMMSEVII